MNTISSNSDAVANPSGVATLSNGSQEAANQLQRRGEVLVALGRRAVAVPGWRTLAYDAAALVAETLNTDQFGVAELSTDRTSLTVRMAATDNEAQEHALPQAIPFAEATSLAGYALSMAQPVATDDLSIESRFQDRLLRHRGLQSAVATPLLHGNASFGALIIAAKQPRVFAIDELQYFETISHMVSATIAHERAREELEQERRFQGAMLDSTPALILTLLPGGQIAQVNKTASKILGFKSGELQEQTLWNVLLPSDELKAFQQAFGQVAPGGNPVLVESWTLTKAHERRKIHWSLAGLANKIGQLDRIVMTGIDVTRQREVEAELAQVRGSTAGDASQEPQPFSVIPAGKHGDRRQRTRRAFPYVQKIAPLIPGTSPENHEYRSVRCRDISPTGFSFLSPTPPDFQDLIVALGADSTTTYLAARVMHATIVERDNKVAYIVGCRYLSRAEPDGPQA
ncbi:MAG TPA: PAS domain S-box protein [Pirellulales bacterium]|jgi:PAS domain S-box-containing protein|nr:PAS domain S-box protein [Pirellulales bacterium]